MNPQGREIVKLACRGMPPRRIADDLGVGRAKVYATLAAARRNGWNVPRFSPFGDGPRANGVLRLDSALISTLGHIAQERGYGSASALASRVLGLIVEDDLFAAILDDEAAPGTPKQEVRDDRG